MRNIPISLSDLTQVEFNILSRCVVDGGFLRASKPDFKGSHYDKWAQYVWRMLVFHLSDEPQHQCMPVMCYYELPRPAIEAPVLDKLVDRVMDKIPVTEWHGVMRWAGLV